MGNTRASDCGTSKRYGSHAFFIHLNCFRRAEANFLMKKYILILLAALSVLSTACSDNEEDIRPVSESELIGTWVGTVLLEKITFNANHTGVSHQGVYSSPYYFTWSLEGDILSTKFNDSYKNTSGQVKFVNDDLQWGHWRYKKENNTSSGGSGTAPSSLVSKTLNLYSSDGSYWMGIVHSSGGSCSVNLYNGAVVSSSYPPIYTYSPNGSNASYYLKFVTQTYNSYYGSYTYAQYVENLTLQFSSSTKGTYSGTQRNMAGSTKQVSGTFQIK